MQNFVFAVQRDVTVRANFTYKFTIIDAYGFPAAMAN